MIDRHRHQFTSHYLNLFWKIMEDKKSPTALTINDVQGIFGVENTINFLEHRFKYYDGGMFGQHQLMTKDLRGREMRCNSFAFDFYLHEDYKRIVDEAALRDGLAWHKLKRFQLLLTMLSKAMAEVSSLKVMQSAINEKVNEQIKEFEGSLQKLRQHKFSIYRRQQQFWMDSDGKLWKKWEIEKFKDDLKLKAIGDDFVMAIQDLAKDFQYKFQNIVPIGPISNYNQVAKATATATTTTTTAATNGTATTSSATAGSNDSKMQTQSESMSLSPSRQSKGGSATQSPSK